MEWDSLFLQGKDRQSCVSIGRRVTHSQTGAGPILSNIITEPILGGQVIPNPGRVMAALGAAHTRIEPDNLNVYFNDLLTIKNGVIIESIKQELGETLKQNEIKIVIDLNQGNHQTTFWGCDLTEKYVRINKRYV